MAERDPYLDIIEAEGKAKERIISIRDSVIDKTHALKNMVSRGANNRKHLKLETDLWLKFRELAKNESKISLKLFEQLGVKYDCLLLLGKKGIGKTGMMKEVFEKADEAGDCVIVGRNRLNELKVNGGETFKRQPEGFFNVTSLHTHPMVLYSRKFFDADDKPAHRGYLVPLRGSDTFFGQDYPKVKYIVFDEVLAHRDNTITEGEMKKFIKFLNSVTRSKKGVKAYFLGNLLETASGSVTQVFLNTFNINGKDNLKIINVPQAQDPKNPVRMLYINTRDLFQGMGDEGGVSELSTNYSHTQQLVTNTIEPSCPLILDKHTHARYNIFFSIVVSYKNSFVAVVVREYTRNDIVVKNGFEHKFTKQHYACSIVGFQPYVHNVKCYTNLASVARSFPESVRYRSDEDLAPLGERLLRIMKSDRFMFGNEDAYNELDTIMKKYYKQDGFIVENLL